MKPLFSVPVLSLAMNYGCVAQSEKGAAPPKTAAVAITSQKSTAPDDFLLRDGDVWVQAGDSITWQKLYTTYLEAFVRARYPQLRFAAVNSGHSGEVTIQGIIRFRNTIAAYQPTIVTSAYGMNDHTKTFPTEQQFQDDPRNSPQRFGDAVKKAGARWAVFSATPLLAPADYATDGGVFQLTPETKTVPPGWRSNPVNRLFADKMRGIAQLNGAPFLDQMAPLQTIWGANYERDRVAALRDALRPFEATPLDATTAPLFYRAIQTFTRDKKMLDTWPAPDREQLSVRLQAAKTAQNSEELRQYLVEWAKKVDGAQPPFVRLSGYTQSERPDDLIHPNEAGHLHMAGVVFKLMNGDGLVSDVELDGKTGRLTSAAKAYVADVTLQKGILSFKRLDESLPLPIDPLARPALSVDVATPLGSPRDLFGMSRYLLKVSGLAAGHYQIAIDGQNVAQSDAGELARGIDLGLSDKGPVAAQSLKLLETVRASLVFAPVDKITLGQPPAPQIPKTLPEAQPVEHTWTIQPVK